MMISPLASFDIVCKKVWHTWGASASSRRWSTLPEHNSRFHQSTISRLSFCGIHIGGSTQIQVVLAEKFGALLASGWVEV
jgi:hypothetical protein